MLLEGNSAKSPRPRRTAADRVRRALTELHGGSLKIRSKPSKGTIVAVRIPCRASEPDGAAETKMQEPPKAAPAA